MRRSTKKYYEVIDEIKSHITFEERCIAMGKKQLKEANNPEAKTLIENDIKAHKISLVTLNNLLKNINN